MSMELQFSGVIPANILPFNPDYSINEKDYRRHLSWLADVAGVTAVTVNGHAAEVSSLNREERRQALSIALDEVGDRLDPLVQVFYAPPFVDMHNRMKEALTILGRIDQPVVRPPLQPLDESERLKIREALIQSGLLEK